MIFARPVQLKIFDTVISCFLQSSTTRLPQDIPNLPETMKDETLQVRGCAHILHITTANIWIAVTRHHVQHVQQTESMARGIRYEIHRTSAAP